MVEVLDDVPLGSWERYLRKASQRKIQVGVISGVKLGVIFTGMKHGMVLQSAVIYTQCWVIPF